jgi:hypothetical protein
MYWKVMDNIVSSGGGEVENIVGVFANWKGRVKGIGEPGEVCCIGGSRGGWGGEYSDSAIGVNCDGKGFVDTGLD